MKNINKYAIALFALVLILIGIFQIYPSVLRQQKSESAKLSPAAVKAADSKDSFTYQGKNNIDALTLIKEKTEIIQDESGLVISINGRTADTKKREFWSFYVNDEMANVGPADYITKDSDILEWKIESY